MISASTLSRRAVSLIHSSFVAISQPEALRLSLSRLMIVLLLLQPMLINAAPFVRGAEATAERSAAQLRSLLPKKAAAAAVPVAEKAMGIDEWMAENNNLSQPDLATNSAPSQMTNQSTDTELLAPDSLTDKAGVTADLSATVSAAPDNLTVPATTVASAFAPIPFTCDATFYQIISGQMNRVDFSGGTAVYVPFGTPYSTAVNSIGYRTQDNFIYGLDNLGGTGDILRIDASGNATKLGSLAALAGGGLLGDFGTDGFYYVHNLVNLYKVDVTTSPPTLVSTIPSALNAADFATNPIDGMLYGVKQNGPLTRINPATGAQTAIGANHVGQFGATYFDSQGNFYAFSNPNGTYSKIDLTTGVETLISTGAASANNDGASCRNAPSAVVSIDGFKSVKLTTDVNGNGAINPGDTVTYTLQYTNRLFSASSFQVNDVLPAGLTISATGAQTVTVSGAGTSASKNAAYTGAAAGAVSNLLAAGAVLARNGTITISIPAVVGAGASGTKSNQATASGTVTGGIAFTALTDNIGATANYPSWASSAPFSLTAPASSVAQTITTAIDPTTFSIVVPVSIAGTVFEDTIGDLLADGAIGGANNPALSGYTVRLFDSAGTQVTTTVSSAAGAYSFAGLAPGTYYVAVDAPTSGIIPEQTYAAAGSGNGGTAGGTTGYGPLCVVGGGSSGSPTYTQMGATTTTNSASSNANGYCYGGQHGATADSGTTTLDTKEHVTRVILSASNVTAVDFGFSPYVVTNTNATAQGSIYQFSLNYSLSVAGGTYNMRFVPAVATNASGGAGNWWEATLTTADASNNVLTGVSNRVVNFNGTARSNTNGTSILDTIPGDMVSSGTAVGNLGRTLGSIPRPEFAINYTGPVTVNTVIISLSSTATAGSSIRNMAMYMTNNGNSYTTLNGGMVTVDQNVFGAKPDGTAATGRPSSILLNNNIAWNGAITLTHNYLAKSSYAIPIRNRTPGVANGYLIQGNYITDNNATGISLEGDSATVLGNYLTGNTAGIYDLIVIGTQSTLNTISENTVTANSTNILLQGPSETVTNNVLTNATAQGGIRANTNNSIKISQNTFGGNNRNSIDLNSNGVTTATATGGNCPTSGTANGGLPRPSLTRASISGTTLTASGFFCNTGTYTLEFYKNVSATGDTGADSLNAGEGVLYLGSIAGLSGGAFTNQTLTFSVGAITTSDKISAIAIRTDGAAGTTLGNTSEFSAEIGLLPILAAYKSVMLTTDADSSSSITPGDTLTYTLQYANTGSVDVNAFQINDALPAGLTKAGAITVTPTGTGTVATANASYTGAAAGAVSDLLAAGSVLKVGGVITVTIPVTINAGATGSLSNQAKGTGTELLAAGVLTDNAGATADLPATVTGAPYNLTIPATSVAQTITATLDPTTVTVAAVATYSLGGKVFEDVNYGGGAGRDLATSSGVVRPNATVELYNATGAYVSSTTTNATGDYSFTGLTAGNYTVRVVNSSVTSSRSGYVAGLLPVQTFRTNASTGTAVADTARVGGEAPDLQDAAANTTSASLSSLTTLVTATQSITPVTLSATNVTGLDFGFNFDTIVNKYDTGQGSLRQFITNSNALTNAGLAQVGQTSGKEVSIFMIPDGVAHAGLRSGLTSGINGTGGNTSAAVITLASALPVISDSNTSIDATTQTVNVGNTNAGTVGTGGTVGVDGLSLSTIPKPEIVIAMSDTIMYVDGSNVFMKGFAFYDSSFYGVIANASATNGQYQQLFAGTLADGSNPGGALQNAQGGFLMYSPSSFSNNYFAYNFYAAAIASTAAGSQFTNNEFAFNGTDHGNHSSLDGDFLSLQASTTVTGNLFHDYDCSVYPPNAAGGSFIEILATTTILNNTMTRGCKLGASVGNDNSLLEKNIISQTTGTPGKPGAGIVVFGGRGNKISQNSIFDNAGLSIDYSEDNVTANNGLLFGAFPNNNMDYPIATSAVLSGGNLSLKGFIGIAGVGNATFANATIEIFKADNSPANQNGEVISGDGLSQPHGEGITYLGSITADANGLFNTSLAVAGLAAGDAITMTATDSLGNTSEFSADFTVNYNSVLAFKSVKLTTDADTSSSITPGDTLTYTLQYANTGVVNINAFQINDALPAGLTKAGAITVTPTGTGTVATANASYTGAAAGAVSDLLAAGGVLKIGGVITVTIPVTINAGATGSLSNQAKGTGTELPAAGVLTDNAGTTADLPATVTTAPFNLTVPATSVSQTIAATIDPTTVPIAAATLSLGGKVFEDVNYGGGAGRDLATSSGVIRANARVELFNSAGNFVSFTTTNATGDYSFAGLAGGNYTVRVVNSSVTSSRPGSIAGLLPVQTYRTNASTGTAVADTARVGGETPSLADAGNGSTTLAALTTASTTAESIAPVTVGASNITGVDFGFNFDTIVNTNDSGQGSLRQFITNSNTLTNAGLAQVGQTAGKETSIFMISNGTAAAGLRSSLDYTSSGIATVTFTSAGTTITDNNTAVDGTTQPGASASPRNLLIQVSGPSLPDGTNMFGINSNNNIVRGLTINMNHSLAALYGNMFAIRINSTSTGNTIQCNNIGSNPAGTALVGRMGAGILVFGSSNQIGGTTGADRNLVVGNYKGIDFRNSAASNNTVQGNYIGTNISGTAILGQISSGIRLVSAGSNNLIGGTATGAGNLISGNASEAGVEIRLTAGTTIQGNLIGTTADGLAGLGNTNGHGIAIITSTNTLVGGATATARNIVSGNVIGIVINTNSTNNTVQGNYVGTDINGTSAIPNNQGFYLASTSNNQIGGSNSGEGNLISGNTNEGIYLDASANTNTFYGNLIGTEKTGVSALPNKFGVFALNIASAASNNIIGGIAPGQKNVIAFSTVTGVNMASGTNNTIRGNSIFKNGSLGIDLDYNLVSPNNGSIGSGANNGIDYPIATSAVLSGGNLTLKGFIGNAGAGNVAFANATIDIYKADNSPADQDGEVILGDGLSNPHGEGKTYLGTITADGNGLFNSSLAVTGLAAGDAITMTATDAVGNTSEFSPDSTIQTSTSTFEAVTAYKSVKLTTDVSGNSVVDPGDTLTYTINYLNTGVTNINSFQANDQIPTGLTLAGAPTVTVAGTGTTASVNGSYTGAAAGAVSNLLSAGGVLKVGGVITVTIPVTINAGTTGILSNQAKGTGTELLAAGVLTDNAGATADLSAIIAAAPYNLTIPVTSVSQTITASVDPTTFTITGLPLVTLVKAVTPTGDKQPGTDLTYQIVFTNTGNAAAQQLVIFDPIPNDTDYKLGSQTMTLGTTGLTMVAEFSNDFVAATPATATWTYVPVSGGGSADTGYDRNVKAVRWRVSAGTLSQISPNHTGEVGFSVKIR